MFERGDEGSGRREEAGKMAGRKIKYQRWDEGLINIKGQLRLKRGGGRGSKKMPREDLLLSPKRNDDYKKRTPNKTNMERRDGEEKVGEDE